MANISSANGTAAYHQCPKRKTYVYGKHFKCEWNTYFERRLDRSGCGSVETGSGRMEILRRGWDAGI